MFSFLRSIVDHGLLVFIQVCVDPEISQLQHNLAERGASFLAASKLLPRMM